MSARCRALPAVRRRPLASVAPVRPAWLILSSLVVWAGCVGRGPAAESPTIARRAWLEVKTEHISFVTDLPRDAALERAGEIEAGWRALAAAYELLAPGAAPPAGTIPVVHFRDCADIKVVYGHGVGGAVSRSDDFEARRVVYTCEHGRVLRGEVIAHELAHRMNHHFFAQLPPWLEEGLATYYQTVRVADGKLVLGEVSTMDAWRGQRTAFLPTVAELRAMDPERFYNGRQSREHYFAAWRLVHLLSNRSDASNARLRGYLRALRDGADREVAWTEAFGDLGAARLQEDYRGYLKGSDMRLWATAYRPPALPVPAVRALAAGEIHELWILHLLNGEPSEVWTATAMRQLAIAERDVPGWSQARFWRAVLAARQPGGGGDADAVRLLQAQVAADPRDTRAWLALVRLRLRTVVPATHLGIEAEPPAGLDALADDVAGLVRYATTAAELDAIASYYALRRQALTGLGFARRATRADISCSACEDTLALLLFQSGRPADAVAHAERAINLSAEDGVPDGYRLRLAAYRAASRPR